MESVEDGYPWGPSRVGMGYRRQSRGAILDAKSELDCLEITTEHFLPLTRGQRSELLTLRDQFELVPHGLALSIGSVDPVPQDYLDAIARVMEVIEASIYTDHFAITRAAGRNLGHLSPIWYSEESLELTIRNIETVRSFFGVPLVLETITVPFDLPGGDMSAPEFISRACIETDSFVLLDVTNIYINSVNQRTHAVDFIDAIPSDRIRYVHIVGYSEDDDGFLIDAHSSPIQSQIWELCRHVTHRVSPEYVIIERDANLDQMTSIIADVRRARTMFRT